MLVVVNLVNFHFCFLTIGSGSHFGYVFHVLSKIRDKHPGSATLMHCHSVICFLMSIPFYPVDERAADSSKRAGGKGNRRPGRFLHLLLPGQATNTGVGQKEKTGVSCGSRSSSFENTVYRDQDGRRLECSISISATLGSTYLPLNC